MRGFGTMAMWILPSYLQPAAQSPFVTASCQSFSFRAERQTAICTAKELMLAEATLLRFHMVHPATLQNERHKDKQLAASLVLLAPQARVLVGHVHVELCMPEERIS